MQSLKKGAFTLVELMVTIIIVAILAALAIPRFGKAVETIKAREARVALEQIRAGERIYRMQEGSYVALAEAADIREHLNVRLDERYWTYTVGTTGTDSFLATAIRKDGPNENETITIDDEGEWGGDWEP